MTCILDFIVGNPTELFELLYISMIEVLYTMRVSVLYYIEHNHTILLVQHAATTRPWRSKQVRWQSMVIVWYQTPVMHVMDYVDTFSLAQIRRLYQIFAASLAVYSRARLTISAAKRSGGNGVAETKKFWCVTSVPS